MEKVIVVSTNNNPDYYAYSRFIKHAWNTLGWKVCTTVTDDVPTDQIYSDYTIVVPSIEGLRKETIAQASRLYAANHFSGEYYLMVSDMDLLPLSDYWHPNLNEITVFGFDLTWKTFIPMGYTGMTVNKWREVMNLNGDTVGELERDAKELGTPYSNDWETWWGFDWSLLTKKLKPYMDKITFVNRGQVNIAGATLARGRVDRYNWAETMKQDEWIDAHCHNQNIKDEGKTKDFLTVFEKVYGKID